MQVLLANLKHFYQYRTLWFVYLFAIFFIGSVGGLDLVLHSVPDGMGRSSDAYFARMFLAWVIGLTGGLTAGTLQMEVVSKPFSFCLPGHRIAFRQLVFLVGLIVILIVSLFLLGEAVPSSLLRLSLCCTGLTAYFIGVSIALAVRNAAMAIPFVPLLGVFVGYFLSRGPSSEYVIVVCSIATIVLGAGSAIAICLWLERTSLFRRRCGRPWLGLSALGSPFERDRYRQAVASAKPTRVDYAEVNGFLLHAMEDCRQSSVARHIWGTLYTWLLPGGGGRSQVMQMGLLSVVSAVLAALAGSMGPFFIANVSIWSGLTVRNLPVFSPLLVAGGRRERFFSTMGLTAILGSILTLGVILAFGAIDLLGPLPTLEQILTGNSESSEQAMNAGLALLLTALFPTSRFLEIALRAEPIHARIAQAILLVSVAELGIFMKPQRLAVPFAYAALGVVLSWLICMYGMYRITMRSDLVRR